MSKQLTAEQVKLRKLLTCDPESDDYDYKYTLRSTQNSWSMIYYFRPLKLDVQIRVYHLDHGRSAKIYDYTKHLLALRSDRLLTPAKVFHWAGELWLVFPWMEGSPLNEVLKGHPNGIANDRLLARILLDVLEGLEVLHKANLAHRGVASFNTLLCKESGITMLRDFTNIKHTENQELRAGVTRMKRDAHFHLKPPEMMGILGGQEKKCDERMADIYLFAAMALNLAYGKPPPPPLNASKAPVLDDKSWVSASHKLYPSQPDHITKDFIEALADCFDKAPSKRPTVAELLKRKFFKNPATHEMVQKSICSLFPKDQGAYTSNKEQPPSQCPDEKMNRAPSSGWDFSEIIKSSHSDHHNPDLGTIAEQAQFGDVGDQRGDGDEEKSKLLSRPVAANSAPGPAPALGVGSVPSGLGHSGLVLPEAPASNPSLPLENPPQAQQPPVAVAPNARLPQASSGIPPPAQPAAPPAQQLARLSIDEQPAHTTLPAAPAAQGLPPATQQRLPSAAVAPVQPLPTQPVAVAQQPQHAVQPPVDPHLASHGSRFHVTDDPVPVQEYKQQQPVGQGDVSLGMNAAGQPQPHLPGNKRGRFHVSNDVQAVVPRDVPVQNSKPSRFKLIDQQDLGSLVNDHVQLKAPNEWNVEEVGRWLAGLGGDYQKYQNHFTSAGIDGKMLTDLTVEEMKELGVGLGIHRRKLATEIKSLFKKKG